MGEGTHVALPPAFTSWLALTGRKASTVKHLTNIFKSIPSNRVKLNHPSNILDFLQELKLKGYSTSHINNYVDCCRVYSKYCKEVGLPCDPILGTLKFVPDKYRPRATMSDSEIESFLKLPRLANTGKVTHEYWRVFFSIMAYTGMRTGEVSKLRVQDVDFSQGIFYLIDTKTNENRLVPIPQNIKETVLAWVNHSKGYLFPSRRPQGHTSNVEWHYAFHTRIKRLGISRPNLTPYSLRHSYITEMLQTEGVNLFDVKNLVGHHDTRTTENYYHLTTKRLKRVSAKHPGVRKHTSPQEVFSIIEEFIDSLSLQPNYKVSKSVSNNRLEFKISSSLKD